MMKDIELITERGIPLDGALFNQDSNSDTVLICITGIHGNFSINPFYYNIGNTLSTNGIDFLYAQTNDAYSRLAILNEKTKKIEEIGSFNEDFNDIEDDINTYIHYAKEKGYKHIILAGHSLGANKIIYYLSKNHRKDIEKFIIISPADVGYLLGFVSKTEREIIESYMDNKKYDELLPFALFGWAPMTGKTADMWINNNVLDNVHLDDSGDYSQLSKISHTGAFLIGYYDAFTNGDAKSFIENNNNHMQGKNENDIIVLECSGHTFEGSEQALADNILEILKKWGY